MDSLISAAARALAAGKPLVALNHVALRDDAPALALRGIAMAQLGDLGRARDLVRRAARAFGPNEAVSRARCIVAETEIAFVSRDLGWPEQTLESARATLERHGDRINAAQARLLAARRLLLLGRLDEAESLLDKLGRTLPPAVRAAQALALAGIAMRRVEPKAARAALARAETAAHEAAIPGLIAEVESALRLIDAPAARMIAKGRVTQMRLDDVAELQASKTLIVDACRHVVRLARTAVSLVSRPVLFALVRALAEAWPGDVARDVLLARAFGARQADESHRTRLRVEIARLRRMLAPLAGVQATKQGFALAPLSGRDIVVLARPLDGPHGEVLALLADGEAWSSSGLALALGFSQRTVQRALDALAASGKAQSFGRGRARRWMTPPLPGFTTSLLLPAPLPD